MVRSVIGMEPDALDDQQWAMQVRMAESMQNLYLRKLGKLLGGY